MPWHKWEQYPISSQPQSIQSSGSALAGDFYVDADSANATAEAFVFDNIVAADIPCHGCRYNLRGVACEGVCPECGKAVRQTLPRRGQVYAYRLTVANMDRMAIRRTIRELSWITTGLLGAWAVLWLADEALLGALGVNFGLTCMSSISVIKLFTYRSALIREQWLLVGADTIVELTPRSRTEVERETIVSATQFRSHLEIRGRPGVGFSNPVAWRILAHHLRAWGIGVGQQRKWDLIDSIHVSLPACYFMMPPSLGLNALEHPQSTRSAFGAC